MNNTMTFKYVDTSSIFIRNDSCLVSQNELSLLTDSIKNNGILVPLCVRPIRYYDYEVIDGRKRALIAKENGILRIPCIVYEYIDDTMAREYCELLHITSGSGSITKEKELINILKEVSELITKLSMDYYKLDGIIKETITNDDNISNAINKCMTDLLVLRHDVNTVDILKNNKEVYTSLLSYLNNIQNKMSVVMSHVECNNHLIVDVSAEISGIIKHISKLCDVSNSLVIYKSNK